MSNFYEQLCQTFIRPSRQVYNTYDLGQPVTQQGRRFDFQVHNNRQHRIMCSFFSNSSRPLAPCLVYLHSLNGSRLQSLSFVNRVLAQGLNFCIFDFSGTGLSQGKYVSLGFFEKYDIEAVLEYVCQKFNIKKFVLWGRSMGAAAAIKFMSMKASKKYQYDINALILDSPFHSLSQITVQLAKQKISMPQIIIKAVLMLIESSIEQKAGFKLSQMQLLEDIKSIQCPVLLLTSKEDKLVQSSQSEQIYEAIRHREREIMFIKGEHNSNREIETVEYVIGFAYESCENRKKISKQGLIKSSKFLNYRHKNCLAMSEAISSKSSSKLQQNSSIEHNVRYETCGDQEVTCAKWEPQLVLTPPQNKSIKVKESKKSINLFSPKISYYKQKSRQEKNVGGRNIVNDFVFGQNQVTKEKRFDINQQLDRINESNLPTSKNEIIQKVISMDTAQKNCMQLNKSPVKQQPKIKIQKKIQNNNSICISKTPDKLLPQFFASQSYQGKLVHSEKRQKCCGEQKDQLYSNIEVNHFNVITDKLKKKKKKEITREPSPLPKDPNQIRNISISMERKSQLPIKSPPELLNLKPPQEKNFKAKLF